MPRAGRTSDLMRRVLQLTGSLIAFMFLLRALQYYRVETHIQSFKLLKLGRKKPALKELDDSTVGAGKTSTHDVVSSPVYTTAVVTQAQISTTKWCSDEACTRGRWISRDPSFDSSFSLKAAYSYWDVSWNSYGPASATKQSPNEDAAKKDLAGQRLLNLMDWVWKPDKGVLRAWNVEDFITRALKSPGGIIFVGDSITRQQFDAILESVDATSIALISSNPETNVFLYTLNETHPSTAGLIQHARVPISRCLRPVLTLIEDYLLIGEKEFQSITTDFKYESAAEKFSLDEELKTVESWEEQVLEASVRGVGPQGEVEEGVEKDTILVVNTGAYWTRHWLPVIPAQSADVASQLRITEVYRRTVSLVLSRLAPIPRLTLYYRSTSPGHPTCGSHSKPYSDAKAARESEADFEKLLKANLTSTLTGDYDLEAEIAERRRWDWDLFTMHNVVWQVALARLERLRTSNKEWDGWKPSSASKPAHGRNRLGGLARLGVHQPNRGANSDDKGETTEGGSSGVVRLRSHYLDIWDQALQRGDAHSAPGVDCLHWWPLSVPMQWTYTLNHLLYLEDSASKAA